MREMKDSGIEWIGEIPKEWEISILSTIFKEHKKKNIGLIENNLLSLSYGRIVRKNLEDNNGLLPTSFETYNVIKKGHIVFRLTDLQNDKRSLRTGLCKEKGIITSAYVTLAPIDNVDTAYMHYLFYIYDICKVFYGMGDGVRQSITFNDLKALKVIVPPLSVQHRIADYLDDKCGKIDRYIEQQKQVIEKLKAYKQSVITEAVTKGLDPTVPMKDSGVEWIGEIPESWVVVKATRLILSTQNGLTRRDLEKSNGNIVLRLRNINSRGEIDYSEVNRIVLSSKEVETYQLIDGDFLFVRVNGSRSLVGKCAIYNDISEIVAYNDHIIRVRLNNFCDKNFFKWFLLSDVGKKEIDIHTSTSAGQFTISGDGLRNLNVILPKKEIQREIVVYLNKKCSLIDSAVEKKQALIERLTEYKKSLIYEVVTGKKEV